MVKKQKKTSFIFKVIRKQKLREDFKQSNIKKKAMTERERESEREREIGPN